jgi:hypothetical protein
MFSYHEIDDTEDDEIKPSLREEDYFCLCFSIIFPCFQDAKLLFYFANMYFVHIAFTADGR